MQIEKQILDIVENLPGVTSPEIQDFLSDIPGPTVRGTLARLTLKGKLLRVKAPKRPEDKRAGGRNAYAYSINPNPTPVARKMKQSTPTEAGLAARLDEAKATIAELERWKADAIKRFPDLAVAPEVLKARKIVAETMAGDKVFVDSVLRGEKDNLPIMKVALTALAA